MNCDETEGNQRIWLHVRNGAVWVPPQRDEGEKDFFGYAWKIVQDVAQQPLYD
ncbi:hypothetical protein BJB45_10170 [Halomonas huangheensis]|uniref:Uncharacterized protein n=1 Tax=Halomonas huangheensis TaxID=1178482 RepID=W1NA18_9GAMM|nr:hypothetical protein BJB45_10170 [Halomonas huangheensis]